MAAIILIYIYNKIHYELIICNNDNSLIERKDYNIQYSFLFYMYSMTGIAGNDKKFDINRYCRGLHTMSVQLILRGFNHVKILDWSVNKSASRLYINAPKVE